MATEAAAACAWRSVSAHTAATGEPSKLQSAESAWMSPGPIAPRTPGAASAAERSMREARARGYGLRTTAV